MLEFMEMWARLGLESKVANFAVTITQVDVKHIFFLLPKEKLETTLNLWVVNLIDFLFEGFRFM